MRYYNKLVVVVVLFIHVNRTYDNIQTSIITCNYENQSTIQYNSKNNSKVSKLFIYKKTKLFLNILKFTSGRVYW